MSMSANPGFDRRTSLSVVVPIYNEEATLQELYRRLACVLSDFQDRLTYEFVFVNDGSTDRSIAILSKLHSTWSKFDYSLLQLRDQALKAIANRA